METPSPYTRFGQKGLVKARDRPARRLTNAVNDALKARAELVCR